MLTPDIVFIDTSVFNKKPYPSYELEEKIANMPFWYSKNLEESFYFFVEALMAVYSMSQANKNAVNKLKNHARQARTISIWDWMV